MQNPNRGQLVRGKCQLYLPVEKVIHGLFPLEKLLFLRVLRTRDRIVRSNT